MGGKCRHYPVFNRLVTDPLVDEPAAGWPGRLAGPASASPPAGWEYRAGFTRSCSLTARITVFLARSRRRHSPAAARNLAASPVLCHPMPVMMVRGPGRVHPVFPL
jgi:hypothetical protein